MKEHYGEIVEYVVRKNGVSITELADGLNVNRRTVYNYFQNKFLKQDIILKIGLLIRHDFSRELPELFTASNLKIRGTTLLTTPFFTTKRVITIIGKTSILSCSKIITKR